MARAWQQAGKHHPIPLWYTTQRGLGVEDRHPTDALEESRLTFTEKDTFKSS